MTALHLPAVAAQLAVTLRTSPCDCEGDADRGHSFRCALRTGVPLLSIVAVDEAPPAGKRVLIVAGEVNQGDVAPGGWVWEYNSSPFPLAIRKGTWAVPIFPGHVVGSAVVADVLPIVKRSYRMPACPAGPHVCVGNNPKLILVDDPDGRDDEWRDISDAAAFTEFTPTKTCARCEGSGQISMGTWCEGSGEQWYEPCRYCKGSGEIRRHAVVLTDAAATTVRCPECCGTGRQEISRMVDDPGCRFRCPRCDGAGTCEPYEVKP